MLMQGCASVVCVCVCVCVCVYEHVNTYIHTHTYMYTVVHKRMFYIRTNLRMLQHSNVECNIRMFNIMQQNNVFW